MTDQKQAAAQVNSIEAKSGEMLSLDRYLTELKAEADALYEDTIPFLQEAKQRGYRIIYLTARKNTQGLQRELERLKLAEYAEQVIVVDPSAAKEEKILATRALLASDPQVILIGDTENEQAVAEATGIPVYLLHRGFRSRKYWKTKGMATYNSLGDVKEVTTWNTII